MYILYYIYLNNSVHLNMTKNYYIHLKASREKAGLSQKEVESRLKLRSLMIRDYEMGRLKLPVSAAIELSQLYGVSLDQLLGIKPLKNNNDNTLENFKSLFELNGFELMFFDPIIRGALEQFQDKYFEQSIFDLLTSEFGQRQKEEIVLEITRFLSSLAGSDHKVSASEQYCLNYLLSAYGQKSKVKSITKNVSEKYLPKTLPKAFNRIEIKHFVIWLLFFFAMADENLVYQEIKYIEEVAQHLKINRSNFLLIQKHFIKEKI